MKYFLFAGNRADKSDSFRALCKAVGGAHSLIGVLNDVSDATVFEAVLEQVHSGLIDYENRIWVNALSIQEHNLGTIHEWEIRIGKSLDDDDLHNCSIKRNVEGLGCCGIVYFENSVLRNWRTHY